MLKIAIDAMGGDFGPEPIMEGLILALRNNNNFTAIAVGDEEQLKPLIPNYLSSRIKIVHTEDVISMSDSATDALKRKESTIYKAIELVKEGEADAVVSAGHSGATMSLATLRIGRIKGVSRPAIATLMPTSENQNTLVLDVGANVDCEAKNLYEFAVMGQVYVQDVMQLDEPLIGLLSNGEEESKGNEVTKEAFKLISKVPNFAGNVEGSDVFKGIVDSIDKGNSIEVINYLEKKGLWVDFNFYEKDVYKYLASLDLKTFQNLHKISNIDDFLKKENSYGINL